MAQKIQTAKELAAAYEKLIEAHQAALEAGVPVSNYGLALAWCNGIFDRATKIFRQ